MKSGSCGPNTWLQPAEDSLASLASSVPRYAADPQRWAEKSIAHRGDEHGLVAVASNQALQQTGAACSLFVDHRSLGCPAADLCR